MTTVIKTISFGLNNVYLINAGDGFVLVDTGLKKNWQQLEKELLSAGCLPDKLKLVIITHGDTDHVGNCRILQEKYNAKIAIHPYDVKMLETGFLPKRTFGNALVNKLFTILSKSLERKNNKKESTILCKPDLLIDEGFDLDEYNIQARILHFPGHTRGSIAVLFEDGSLICGDTFVNFTKPVIWKLLEDEEGCKATIDKYRRLKVHIIYPGHGKPFTPEKLKL